MEDLVDGWPFWAVLVVLWTGAFVRGTALYWLGRGARAIGVRGRVYSTATIDSDLFIRAEEKKVRRAGERTKGPSAFTDRDRRRFVENLEGLLGIW